MLGKKETERQLNGKSAHLPTRCTLPWGECDLEDTNLLFPHSNFHEHLLVEAPCCTSVILMFLNTMESHNMVSKCKSILSCLQWKEQQTVPMLAKKKQQNLSELGILRDRIWSPTWILPENFAEVTLALPDFFHLH